MVHMLKGDFENDSTGFASCATFIAFVFLVSIVFINFLNGVAIDDIVKMRENALQTRFQQRCKLLALYEKWSSNSDQWFRYVKLVGTNIFGIISLNFYFSIEKTG